MESSYSKLVKTLLGSTKPSQSIPNVNMADFAQAAYNPTDDFEGYDLSKEYSSPDRAVWVSQKKDHAIISFRGTDPKNLKDIGTDILLGSELKGLSTRFSHAENITQKLMTKFGKNKVYVTGHSLGASQALHVSQKLRVYAEVYNPFVSFTEAETNASFPNAVVHWNVGDPVGIGVPFLRTKKTNYHYNWNASIRPIGPLPVPLAVGGLSQHSIANLVSKSRRKKSKPNTISSVDIQQTQVAPTISSIIQPTVSMPSKPETTPKPQQVIPPNITIKKSKAKMQSTRRLTGMPSYKPSVTTIKRSKQPKYFFGLKEVNFT